ncbi:MAG TPA: lysophospholipid acyltransferase family protein [Pyrinomonadaceae bacterium]|nr:lysophospholipid acyltransferase family protein [Pyrinomonadaceae bacterium]
MAKQGKIKTNLEYLAARSVLAVFGLLPASVAMASGRMLGRLAYFFATNLRKTGLRNLELAFPEKSLEERRAILKGCFLNLGRVLGVFSQLSTRSADSLRDLIAPEGLNHLENAKAEGKGLILFTAHLGAWELTSFGLSLIGHPISFLVRRIDNPEVEKLVDDVRMRFGNQTLDKLAAARSMVKILRSGQVLGLLLDLNTLDDEGIFVDFFGVPASTNFITAKLALRTGSAIIPVFAPWDDRRKKFLLQVQPRVSTELSGDEDTDVRRLTEKLSLIIENEIRNYPDQWLWIHRRWKTRPPGEASIY